ncbi:MAG: glycosyltransferase [Acidobacteria bacterium]|nr:glycosyltransferase [Acidobacteriota bacterium]
MAGIAEGRVSVIIPARNEEAAIASAVRSVAAQRGVREILVVDDQSEDRTGEILRGLKAELPSLRSIRIEALPEGWVGKPHALAAGARLAEGEWLLFTDADTEHLPESLAALLDRAESEKADLLSVSPAQKTVAWWEKSVIPLVYTRLARLYRFEEVSDPQSPAAAANGQYLLVRREVYERIGGHEAVRDKILEDVELARLVKGAGGRLVFLSGAEWVETRMYRSFVEMWRGWTKNLYLLYERRLDRVLMAVAEVWFLDLAPPLLFLALCLVLALGRGSAPSVLAAVAFFLLAVIRQWGYARDLGRLGFDLRLASFQVPGAALLGLLLLNSARVHRWSRRIEWKGRGYATEGKQ